MCVTSGPAEINDTRVLTYVTYGSARHQPVHYSFYQNRASERVPGQGPNCMFLQFPTAHLEAVDGPNHTHDFMRDVTAGLPDLVYVPRMRGATLGGLATRSALGAPVVVEHGDYHLILCSSPSRILEALDQVPPSRRPAHTAQLEALAAWYGEWYPDHSFVLACFNGSANPRHPIAVRYVPNNDDVVFAPGLDGHTGNVPIIGQPIVRDFYVAFAVQGQQLPISFRYQHGGFIIQPDWAPLPNLGVAGFHDNRFDAPNGDYTVAVDSLRQGASGHELVDVLI
ncbi:MAG TPA: hypothetical protein VK694_06640 [Verrucomicrobiae bacterium]|nr:hypothetical protein [Verrucomicrobiae bacterium]